MMEQDSLVNKTKHVIINENKNINLQEDGTINNVQYKPDVESVESKRIPSWVDIWPQIFAAFSAFSVAIQAGIGISYAAILIPQLAKDESIENFTKVEASWIASITTIATPVGALFVGPIMDAVGRKLTLILSTIPITISWVITYFTTTVLWPIYIARFLVGFGSGMTTAAIVYTAEVSNTEFRPVLLCLNSVAVALGILLTTILGAYLQWKAAALCFSLLTLTSLALCVIIPESPYWYLHFRQSESRHQMAKKELRWLNRPRWLYQMEWERLKETAKNVETTEPVTLLEKLNSIFNKFTDRNCLFPLGVLMILFLLQQLTGVYVIMIYAVNIFQNIGGNFGGGVDEYTANIILGVLRFIMSIVTAVLSRRVGRRALLIVSGIGMCLSCLSVACLQYNSSSIRPDFITRAGNYTYVENGSPEDTLNRWFTLVSLLLFVCTGSLGVMSIPWMLLGELMPTNVRAITSGFIVSYAYVLLFVVTKTFPFLLDYISLATIFLLYSVMSALSIIYVYFFLPETFGKSFTEIAKSFEKHQKT